MQDLTGPFKLITMTHGKNVVDVCLFAPFVLLIMLILTESGSKDKKLSQLLSHSALWPIVSSKPVRVNQCMEV